MRDNPEGALHPAVDDHRHCKDEEYSSSVLSYRGQKKAASVAAKSGQFTAGESGKGHFL